MREIRENDKRRTCLRHGLTARELLCEHVNKHGLNAEGFGGGPGDVVILETVVPSFFFFPFTSLVLGSRFFCRSWSSFYSFSFFLFFFF